VFERYAVVLAVRVQPNNPWLRRESGWGFQAALAPRASVLQAALRMLGA